MTPPLHLGVNQQTPYGKPERAPEGEPEGEPEDGEELPECEEGASPEGVICNKYHLYFNHYRFYKLSHSLTKLSIFVHS